MFSSACFAVAALVVAAPAAGVTTHAGCSLFDFARPGAKVPGSTVRYDSSGFWSDASNGWVRQEAGPGRISVDPSRKLLPGRPTLRLDVHPGDVLWGGERADVLYTTGLGIAEGQTQWWAWSTATAPTYRAQTKYAKWNVLMDFHSTGVAPQPNIAFAVDASTNRLAFDVYAGNPVDPHWASHGVHRLLARFVPGRRYDFVFGVHWSADQARGWVEVWVNGHRYVRRTPTATLWTGQLAYPKLANYRAPGAATWANVVWDAGFRRGATRTAVTHCLR